MTAAPAPRRVVISTDAKNEADDQFAIVHALLTATLDVRGIVPAHFGMDGSMARSREEVDLLLDLLVDAAPSTPVADGAQRPLPDEHTPRPSAGSRLIASEAIAAADAESTLFLPVLGPLTDVASALLETPAIAASPVVVVWVGGPPYEGIAGYSPEFNLVNDVHAANVVMASRWELWQIPMSVYTMIGVGHAELEERLRGTSPVGDYLVDQLVAFNRDLPYGPMDFRSLGDSPAIGAVMNPLGARWTSRPARRFTAEAEMAEEIRSRPVRVCESVDTRWLIEDMFAKLRAL